MILDHFTAPFLIGSLSGNNPSLFFRLPGSVSRVFFLSLPYFGFDNLQAQGYPFVGPAPLNASHV